MCMQIRMKNLHYSEEVNVNNVKHNAIADVNKTGNRKKTALVLYGALALKNLNCKFRGKVVNVEHTTHPSHICHKMQGK